MSLQHTLRKLAWKVGYDVHRFDAETSGLVRRRQLLKTYGIDVVLDVGANEGQYASELRDDIGYRGKIVSFEPLSSAYQKLAKLAAADSRWQTVNCALGEQPGEQQINVSDNSVSSSLLDILPAHTASAPGSEYVARETIRVDTLDALFDDYCSADDNVYLKIDTQGFERQVLTGAEQSLSRVNTIQLEMSLAPLYAGELLFPDMLSLLVGMGYTPVSLEPGFTNLDTGQLLQVDGIFHRD